MVPWGLSPDDCSRRSASLSQGASPERRRSSACGGASGSIWSCRTSRCQVWMGSGSATLHAAPGPILTPCSSSSRAATSRGARGWGGASRSRLAPRSTPTLTMCSSDLGGASSATGDGPRRRRGQALRHRPGRSPRLARGRARRGRARARGRHPRGGPFAGRLDEGPRAAAVYPRIGLRGIRSHVSPFARRAGGTADARGKTQSRLGTDCRWLRENDPAAAPGTTVVGYGVEALTAKLATRAASTS